MRFSLVLVAVTLGCGASGAGSTGDVEPVHVAPASVEPAASTEPATPEAAGARSPSVACPDAFDPGDAPETMWTCSMHPRERQVQAGSCPVCGMQLVEDRRATQLTIEPPADVASVPAYAYELPSGLATCVLRPGQGIGHPTPSDYVAVHYVGWTSDGESFDTSLTRSDPATFRVDRLIEGWVEGLQLMIAGEARRLWIPAELAYGDQPRPGRPHGMLVFDVELVGVEDER